MSRWDLLGGRGRSARKAKVNQDYKLRRAVVETLEERRLLAFVMTSQFAFDHETGHKVNVTFNQPVNTAYDSFTTSDISFFDVLSGQQYAAGDLAITNTTGNSFQITFPGINSGLLPDGWYELVLNKERIHNAAGQGMNLDRRVLFFALTGDVNRDRSVDQADQDIVLGNFGLSGMTYSQGDTDYSGTVSSADLNNVQNHYGTTLPMPPIAPGTTYCYALSSTSIRTFWMPQITYDENDNPIYPDAYHVYRSTDGASFTQVGTASGTASDYIDTGLLSGTKYWYRIRAYYTGQGESASTIKYSAVTNMPAPTDLILANGVPGTVLVSWQNQTNNPDASYVVQWQLPGEEYPAHWLEVGNDDSAIISDLPEGQTVKFSVYCYNDVSGSWPTPEKTITVARTSPHVTESFFHFEAAPHALRFTFDADVSASLSVDDLDLTNLSTGAKIPASNFTLNYLTETNTAVFTLNAGTPAIFGNGNYEAILNADGITVSTGASLNEDTTGQDHRYEFFFLNGDMTRDRANNTTDYNLFVGNLDGQSGTFSRGDFNYDGFVNFQDINPFLATYGMNLGLPPTTPGEVSALALSAAEISLAWAQVSGVDGYNVYRSTDGTNFTYLNYVAGASSLNHTDTNLAEGTKYWYRIRAVTGTNVSASVNKVSAVTLLPAPTDLSLDAASSTSVDVSWASGSTNEAGFVVEWALPGQSFDGSNTLTVGAGVTSATVAGLTENKTYSIRVYAYNSAIESGATPVQKININPPTPDVTSGGLDYYYAPHELNFTFNTDVSETIGSATLIVTNLTTGQIIDGSLFTVSYDYLSNVATFTLIQGDPAVFADGNYEARLMADGITNRSGVTLVGNSAGGSEEVLEFFFLNADGNHDRYVDGIDYIPGFGITNAWFSAGDYNYDRVVDYGDADVWFQQLNTYVPPPPDQPGEVVVTSLADSYNSLELSWEKVAGADGYKIYRSTDGTNFAQIATIPDPDAEHHTDQNLIDGTKYWYRIRSYTAAAGNSASVNKAWGITKMRAPTNLAVPSDTELGTPEIGTNWVELTWQDNSASEANYIIERATGDGEFDTQYVLPANTTSYTVNGLSDGTKYRWRIKAVSATTESLPSSELTTVTLLHTPDAPVIEQITNSSVTVSWNPPAGNADAIRLEHVTNLGSFQSLGTFDAGTTSLMIDNLKPGDAEAIRVVALNDDALPAASPPIDLVVGAGIDYDDENRRIIVTLPTGADLSSFDPSDPADFKLTNLTTGTAVPNAGLTIDSVDAASNRIFIDFNDVILADPHPSTDGNYEGIIPAGAITIDGEASADEIIGGFFVFSGDVTRDRLIDTQDFNVFAGSWPLAQAGYRLGDLDYDGAKNPSDSDPTSDYSFLIGKWGGRVRQPLDQPGNFTLTATDSETILLAWTQPANIPSPGAVTVAGYTIYRSDDGLDFTEVATITSAGTVEWEDTDVEVGTRYWYRIRGTGTSGWGATTSRQSIVPIPAAPSNAVATQIDSSEVQITWTPSPMDVCSYVILVSRGEEGEFVEFKQVPDTQTSFTYHSPMPGTTRFKVAAKCGETWSAQIDAVDPGTGNPADYDLISAMTVPTGLGVSGTAWIDGVNLNWDAADYADSYYIEWSNDNAEFYVIDEPEGASYLDEYPTIGGQYYRVRGIILGDDVYESPPSASIPVTPLAPPVAWYDDNGGANERGTLSKFSTPHDEPVVLDLLPNDAEYEGQEFEIDDFTQPDHGEVDWDEDGNLVYTPDPGFVGTDIFEYSIIDVLGIESMWARAAVDVTNSVPVAQNAQFDYADWYNLTGYQTYENVPLEGNVSSTDEDGDEITYVVLEWPEHGELDLDPLTGEFSYQLNGTFNGSDRFIFAADDGIAEGLPAVVTITNAQSVVRPIQNVEMHRWFFNFDSAWGYAEAEVLDEPEHGELSDLGPLISPPNPDDPIPDEPTSGWLYAPEDEYAGDDSFEMRLRLGALWTKPFTFSLYGEDSDSWQPAVNILHYASPLAPTSITAEQSGFKPDGWSGAISILQNAAYGTVSLTSAGAFTYTPNPLAEYTGWDFFCIRATDPDGDTYDQWIQLNVGIDVPPPPQIVSEPESDWVPTPFDGSLDNLEAKLNNVRAQAQSVLNDWNALGQAVQAVYDAREEDDDTIDNLTDAAISALDAVQSKYLTYQDSWMELMGNAATYQKTKRAYLDNYWETLQASLGGTNRYQNVLIGIQALPRDIGGLRPQPDLLEKIGEAISAFDNGAGIMVKNAGTVVEVAKTTHNVLQAVSAVHGGGMALFALRNVVKQAGYAACARMTATMLATSAGAAYASTKAEALAAELGVSEDYIRIGADALQVVTLWKLAKMQRQGDVCFVAGTQVAVGFNDDGSLITRAIEEIEEGDYVLSRNQYDAGDALDLRPVTQVFRKTSDHIRIVIIEGDDGNVETIRTTDEHPFYVQRKGWTSASNLTVGDLVQETDGTWQTILTSTRETHSQGIAVHNFEVEGDHTYFVEDGFGGVDAVWVHNTCFREKVLNKWATKKGKYLAGLEVHHVVPQRHESERLIAILDGYGIDINDISNGVPLPWQVHREVHDNIDDYVEAVERELLGVIDSGGNASALRQKLEQIAEGLFDGSFSFIVD